MINEMIETKGKLLNNLEDKLVKSRLPFGTRIHIFNSELHDEIKESISIKDDKTFTLTFNGYEVLISKNRNGHKFNIN